MNSTGYHPHLFLPVNHAWLSRFNAIYPEAFQKCFEYLQLSQIKGPVLEFGTFFGYSASVIAYLLKHFQLDWPLYLYDSFQGLPEPEHSVDQASYEVKAHQVWLKGAMNVPEEIPDQIHKGLSVLLPLEQIHVIPGFFSETLPASLPKEPAALVHLDCDLYASSLSVLKALLERELFQDGCLLLMDDYSCNKANPKMGQRRALREAFAEQERWSISEFMGYGWGSKAFFVHDTAVEPV
ncbi:hypothetical protein COW36_19310 [bacterium (Candidatus Blackallbacteria) CG17_big_fil_post_rev_8_21_14_2_50_48_46]|uniref:Methyltransferase n=1 Tax=bacterium (Candidatus Blackallbacteria) CG17_big_fil_post_rev_8_21_14_2_50_48_46 TaxID=2014261 RepID=A0A2M7G066_9BACT|nr:MAG: hypothetical protein COW64_25160 [bacterium (Candidatus Blackallbacteria) CG18_big_fil_WC_8_21_14_2_50_49_26]PIW15072.1 MAG: hypothetical protein COW36_19310 [bacterium (Candidatus Blackallbacteria) CG17_big_fil_post_rev_8_21_14_2_50_48_46]PIW47605.1 MAG: hypothetical protein COW20_12010 [bacterium (Candidatus Blackallbacteria) CG13_big_fil_rev_8_21_14_2_50_49_14]